MVQYKGLICTWSRLLDLSEVSCKAWLPSPGPERKFPWSWWWQAAHTDSRFCPSGIEAAFTLFHFTGMFGVSEARAESVASLLKRYSPTQSVQLGVDRVIEKKTNLRCSGIQGDGSE